MGNDRASTVTTSRSARAGSYAIDGWEIRLKYSSGRDDRLFYCASSDAAKTIVVGGSRLVRATSR